MTQTDGVDGRPGSWYADPVTVGAARYWDGRRWTDLVSWGGATRKDPTPLGEVDRREALAEAAVVSRYLADAVRRDVITPTVANVLRLDVEQRVPGGVDVTTAADTPFAVVPVVDAAPKVARPASLLAPRELGRPSPLSAPPSPTPPSSELPAPTVAPLAGSAETVTTVEHVAPLPRQPGQFARWWSEAHVAVRSDLALNGLAYLGVLLLFAGVTGLITFAFGDVAPWVRLVAELMVPSALFVSAWYLQRRGASVVGASLTLLGGAITPIVAAASLTDGAPFPPDLTGRSLPIGQAVAVGVVGAVMALAVGRDRSSPLRFVAGPALWMAAGLAAGMTRDPVPAGYDAARPDSLQLAVIFAALAATLLLCSWRRAPAELSSATRLVALPVAAAVYILEIVLAADEDWPLAGTLVIGLAALLVLELSSRSLPASVISGLQLVVTAVAATRLSAKADVELVAAGAAVALLALVEYAGWRRPVQVVTLAGLGLSGAAALLTLSDMPATAGAFGALTAWGLWRHLRPAEWLPATDEFGVVPAVAATVTAGALWDLSDHGPAVVVTAAIVFAIAIVGRLWRAVSDDALWKWFVPTAAAAVSVTSMAFTWGELPVEVAVAAAMSAGAIALSALPSAVRVWVTSAVIVWSLANVAEALDIGRDMQGVALAAAALVLLVGSLVVARPICAHFAAIGHVAGLAALAAPTWPGWAATAVVGAATVGWWTTTIIDERGEAIHLTALRIVSSGGSEASAQAAIDADDPASELSPLASLVGLWGTVFLAVDAAGWVARDDPWAAAVSSGVVLVGAAVVRFAPWRRARRPVLAWATLIGAVAAAVVAISVAASDRGDWSPLVCLALGLAVVGVAEAPRPAGFIWTAWVGGAALAVHLADRLGLDRDWTDVALAGWGAAALVGGLVVHRVRFGPLPVGTFVRERFLLPPTVLGASAFVVGGTLGLGEGSDAGIGWTAAGMSIVVLVVAVLLPLGALVALAQALATAAYVLLAPWEPLDRPWTLVPWALLLLGASLATRRSGEWSAARWDLPSFLVAHGVAALGLLAAVDSDTVVATYAGFGAVAVAIAVVLRRWPWAAAGAALVLIAGADAGHGWLALVLAIEGFALTVAGLLRTRLVRLVLVAMGAMAIVGAWFDVTTWQSWSMSTVFDATVPAGAVIVLVAALGLRSGRGPRELAEVWAIAGSLATFGTAAVGLGEVAPRPGGLILAGSLIVLAVAAALTAVLFGAGMRWLAAALAAAAWAPAAWAIDVSQTTATLVGTGVALGGLATALAVHGRRPQSAWLRPGAFYATATQAAAAIVALAALPDRDLIIVVLLAVSAELIAFGVLSGRPELYVASPVPACAAWLLYAADALAGEANWFTMPIGLTLLVMVALVRWIRRGRGGDPAAYDVISLEFVGMSFLVASALARTLAGQLWNGVLAIGIGVVVAAWGVVTRVRWRAGFGAVSVLLATVLLIGVPLSRSVTWRGPALWATLSVIGVLAIAAAAALERRRDRVGLVVRRIDEMTAGWERMPRLQDRSDRTDPTPDSASEDAGDTRQPESIVG